MDSPQISVILPTRNRSHLLPRALRSVFAQTCPDFEIILVDDNAPDRRVSRDPSLTVVLRDPRLRVIENDQPLNAARARNLGLHACRTEWVTFLDDDDAYHPAKLEKQYRCARETGLPLGLCGLAYHLKGRRRLRQVTGSFFTGPQLLLAALADTKAIFHRRNDTVLFNETLDAGEDAYYFHALIRHFSATRVFNVPEPLIDVFPQPGSRVNVNADAWARTNQAIYENFAGYYGGPAAHLFLARARFQTSKLSRGGWGEMIKRSWLLFRLGGVGETRAILNGFLFKIPSLVPSSFPDSWLSRKNAVGLAPPLVD